MRTPAKRRAPHGATSAMVWAAIVRLHTQGGERVDVSRADLLHAVSLPETTIDDRLRTLVKQGTVLRSGRARYRPKPWPGQDTRQFESAGTWKTTFLPNGLVHEEKWSEKTSWKHRSLI
ncbi:hypothetical protein ACWKW4_14825 [Hydrogenophaga borbori]